MLHDFLFALLGKPGSFYKQVEPNGPFQADDSLKIFSQPEINLLNHIVQLGFHYQQIERYLESQREVMQLELINNSIDSTPQQIGGGAYAQAFIQEVHKCLQVYRNAIVDIEDQYLKEKVFMVSELNARLSQFFTILPDLHKSIKVIIDERLGGGQLLDYLHSKMQSGNIILHDTYGKIMKACYLILYKQLEAWLCYGYILDSHEEFFIQRIEERKNHVQKTFENQENKETEDYHWENSYSLKISMLSMSFITVQQAEKILFVGKSVKVLKAQTQQYTPSEQIMQEVAQLREYDTFTFNKAVEQIRLIIGKQLLGVIIQKSELLVHLNNIKQFVLLGNGDFFQTFLDEAQSKFQLPPTQDSLYEINQSSLIKVLSKLQNEDENFKRLSFAIFHNGFEFKNFSHLTNLLISGNIIQTSNNNLRLGAVKRLTDSSGIYYNMKQSVENGFSTQFTFRFKPQVIVKNPYKLLEEKPHEHQSSIFFTLYNTDINKVTQGFFQTAEQAILIRLTLNSTKGSSMSVEAKKGVNYEKLCRWRFDPNKIDFAEGDLYTLKISYKNDELVLILDDGVRLQEPVLETENFLMGPIIQGPDQLISHQPVRIPFKIQKYLQLEMGRCHVALINEGENGVNLIDVCTWKLTGYNGFNNEDPWNGLNLRYSINYPLTLLITPAFQEKLAMLFRYFFPIRHTIYELNDIWLTLTKRAKQGRINSEKKYSIRNQYQIFNSKEFRYIMIVHNQISHVITSFWNYFQYDILQIQWSKLLEKIKTIQDFEQLRKFLDEFQINVSNFIFLNFPQIIKPIFEIIRFARRYVALIQRYYYEQTIETIYKESIKINSQFQEVFMNLFNILTLLNQQTNQINLLQLLTRLDYNDYFIDKNSDQYKKINFI